MTKNWGGNDGSEKWIEEHTAAAYLDTALAISAEGVVTGNFLTCLENIGLTEKILREGRK